MMLESIFYVCKILTFSNYLQNNSRISLVVDRKIKKILNEDGSEAKDIFLRDDMVSNKIHESFLWDRNFPQPYFHFIDCENFLFSKSDNKNNLSCLSDQEEKIFELEIEKSPENLLNVNFYDINKDKLNIKNSNNSGNEFIISNKIKNLESIKNSLDYVLKLDQLTNEYMNVIGWFSTFLECIRILMKSAANLPDFDEHILAKIIEVQKYTVEMTNILFKSLATIRVPRLDKLEYIESYDVFIKNMDELAEMIKELITIIAIHITDNDDDDLETNLFASVFELFVKDAESFIEMLESDEEASLADRYDKLLTSLEFLAEFFEEAKDNVNTEITNDCDVKKVDKFFEKYSYLLIEYCDILNDSDEVLLNEFYYHESIKSNLPYMNTKIEMYFDILVAKEMKRYLHDYNSDKTDFLIFSQTDYFKNKLFNRIIDNLDSLSFALNFKKKFEETIQGITIELSGDEINYLNKIKNLHEKFSDVITYTEQSSPHSFEFVVSSMPIEVYEKDFFDKNGADEEINTTNETEQEKDQIIKNTSTEITDTEQDRKEKNDRKINIKNEENLDDENMQVDNKEKIANILNSDENFETTNLKYQNNGSQSTDNILNSLEKENNLNRYFLLHSIFATAVTFCLLGLLIYLIVFKIERKVIVELDPKTWHVPENK